MDAELLRKASGICCLIAPIVALSMIGLAVSEAPWFSWRENALSDLGVGQTASTFNSGLMLGGILLLLGAPGLAILVFKDRLARIGVGLFTLACIWLLCIGIFPESAGRIHFIVSVGFFTFLSLSLIVLGLAMVRSKARWARFHALLALVLGVTAALAWTLPHRGVAIPEIISSVAGSVWIAGLGARLLQGPWCTSPGRLGSS